jgi:tRNA A37 N6-isopentenylltransferase MiaA
MEELMEAKDKSWTRLDWAKWEFGDAEYLCTMANIHAYLKDMVDPRHMRRVMRSVEVAYKSGYHTASNGGHQGSGYEIPS